MGEYIFDIPFNNRLKTVQWFIIKAFEGGIPTDSPQNRARTLTQVPPADQEDLGDVKLVVQSFDPQMPELTWEDTWQAGGHQQVLMKDMNRLRCPKEI